MKNNIENKGIYEIIDLFYNLRNLQKIQINVSNNIIESECV